MCNVMSEFLAVKSSGVISVILAEVKRNSKFRSAITNVFIQKRFPEVQHSWLS